MYYKSDSDVTSWALSSPPPSPKKPVYYVLTPSSDGDKLSSMLATPVFNSPVESSSHPSFARYSGGSSATRYVGAFRLSSGRQAHRERNDQDWAECQMIEEEGSDDDLDDDEGLTRRGKIILASVTFVLILIVFWFIIWSASRRYKPDIVVQSITIDHLYAWVGLDRTDVPTKMITLNCSLTIDVHNTAQSFGIHVKSSPIKIFYSALPIATGQLKKYYQPRKSRSTVEVIVRGAKVPLYGAGIDLVLPTTNTKVPMHLHFDIRSTGYVVWKLLWVTHRRHIVCRFTVDTASPSKLIMLPIDACTYT
ncbi:uncharacterized protein LOC144703236 [Wolffia australiana]